MSELILRVLGFLLRLLVLAVTGEWPGSNDDSKAAPKLRPIAAKPPASAARAKRQDALDFEAIARTQRSDPKLSRMLADVDAVLAALAEPIVVHAASQGIALPELRFSAVANVSADRAKEATQGSTLIPVSVSERFADTPEHWVFLGRHVGRALFEALPGWASEIYRAHRLPPTLFVPPGHGAYDADTARAALGVWLPELFADAFATHSLGPGYASALATSLARPMQPMDTLVARTQGRFLSTVPPAAIRMHVAFAALQRLGLHEWQQRLRTRWELAHGASESLYLPLSDGRLMAVPLAYMLGELDPILVTLLDEPQVALGQETWLDVPGFAYLHAEHAQAQRVADAFLRSEAVDAPPRVLIAGAALAMDTNDAARAKVTAALARSIRGAGTLDAAPNAFDGSLSKPGGAHPTLAAALRDQGLVRDALVIGAAFVPLKRRRFRS